MVPGSTCDAGVGILAVYTINANPIGHPRGGTDAGIVSSLCPQRHRALSLCDAPTACHPPGAHQDRDRS